jgi:hypothetical protein
VNDLLADVDRGAEGLQRNLHDIDGPHHACAEAARLQKQYSLGGYGIVGLVNFWVVEDSRGHITSIACSVGGVGKFEPSVVHPVPWEQFIDSMRI